MTVKTSRNNYTHITEHLATGIDTDNEMFACHKEFLDNNPTKLELWDMTGSELSKITIAGMR